MARPIKDGLDYFPLNTKNDDKFDLIEARHGIIGYAIIIKLYQKIYDEFGYFYPWGERQKLLFSRAILTPIEEINPVIESAVEFGFFDQGQYDSGILTSKGIQRRYFEASKRRKIVKLYSDILLIIPELTDSQTPFYGVFSGKNPEASVLNSYNNPQSKVKESKVKGKEEIKEERESGPDTPDPEEFYPSSQKTIFSCNDSSTRIEALRKTWNESGLPEMRRNILTFTQVERTECLATISVYSNDEIEEAMHNYKQVISEPEYDLPPQFQYKSFQSFIGKGVEKFSASAKPFEVYKKRTGPPGAGKKIGVTDMSDIEF